MARLPISDHGWTLNGLLLLLMLTAPVPRARADDDTPRHQDQDAALEALQRGEVRPLAEILRQLQSKIAGEIVETEFENKKGIWIYELKIISPSGRMREIEVDAANGRILRTEDD